MKIPASLNGYHCLTSLRCVLFASVQGCFSELPPFHFWLGADRPTAPCEFLKSNKSIEAHFHKPRTDIYYYILYRRFY